MNIDEYSTEVIGCQVSAGGECLGQVWSIALSNWWVYVMITL